MKTFPLSLLLLLPLAMAALSHAATPAAPAAPVSATLTLRDPATLDVSYALPDACPALAFRNADIRPDIAAGLRSDWRAADDCTDFDGKQLRRRQPSCSVLRLRVPATIRSADRVYPWAYPVEHGVYAHTGAYALTDACGPVDWHFAAPGGTVVVDGKAAPERGERSAAEGGGDAMPTVLIQQRFAAGALPRVHASSAFAPSTARILDATLSAIDSELRRMLPGLAWSMPFVVASPSAPGSYWGDVANRTVMRLSFPPLPGPEQEQLLHAFVTHEMAHLTQPSDWNDAWRRDSATIGEGGAEFLRVATAYRLGWIDRAGLQAELEKAVNGCLLAAGGTSWKAMRNRNWGMNPYECGLTFYLIGLAADPQATAPGGTPLLRLRDYYARAKRGEPTDFAHALECGASAGCTPRWLPRLAGDDTLDGVLLDASRQPGALLRATPDWGPAMDKPLAFHLLGMLMRADCKGGVSMFKEAAAARIADGPVCATLREGMVVVGAQGLPLFDGNAAVKASLRACRESGHTVLDLRGGGNVTLACNASVALPARFYGVDIDRALALLK